MMAAMKFPSTVQTRFFSSVFLAGTLVFTFVVAVSGQTNPPMPTAQLENEKEALYARFNDYKRNPNPEQQRFAYPTAKDYLLRWGGDDSNETKEVRKWVTQYERAMHEEPLYAAYASRDYARTISLARPWVKSDPEYFFAWGM